MEKDHIMMCKCQLEVMDIKYKNWNRTLQKFRDWAQLKRELVIRRQFWESHLGPYTARQRGNNLKKHVRNMEMDSMGK